MLDIGQQIKRLREERRITGKELAQQIGLSQSQMSRLEQGQRRIDTEILARIASALEVSPAQFFGEEDAPAGESDLDARELSVRREKELALSQLHSELGKLIRSERRRRHLTMDDLARKTGHTRAYVAAVEEGRRNGLEGGFLRKALKLLAIDPMTVIEAEERIIRDLKTRVHRLDQALATRGGKSVAAAPALLEESAADEAAAEQYLGTPILVGDESVYPADFDEQGRPVAAVEGFLSFPDLIGRPTFAVRVAGDAMDSGGVPTYREGDLVVFATDRSARSGESAFVRFDDDRTEFRMIYHDDEQVIRLQPLKAEIAPTLLELSQVQSAWPLVAHVHTLVE